MQLWCGPSAWVLGQHVLCNVKFSRDKCDKNTKLCFTPNPYPKSWSNAGAPGGWGLLCAVAQTYKAQPPTSTNFTTRTGAQQWM